MSLWIIEPREPLIFRDGRPFDANPGVRAHSLSFPFPSTTTGAARTQIGLDKDGVFTMTSEKELEELKQTRVRGPLLVQLPEPGEEQKKLCWFAPAPADALLLKPEQEQTQAKDDQGQEAHVQAELKRLVPLQIDGAQTDLAGLTIDAGLSLHLVGSATLKNSKGKPADKVPGYWHWKVFEKWLLHPNDHTIKNWHCLGIYGPQNETRVHIRMDRNNHTSEDGALFETRGMDFSVSDEGQSLHTTHQLALAVGVDHAIEHAGLSTLGGERRMVYWRSNDADFPQCPDGLVKQIKEDRGACRVILLTPAYFERGCYPEQLLKGQIPELKGIQAELQAIAVQRPQVVSGWEFVRKSTAGKSSGKPGPKETRRLAPAGSVFFLKLPDDAAAIEQWVKALWMQSISDTVQDRFDGFGLTVIGTWDGIPQNLEGGKQA